jgi:hypothetical protein
MVESRNPIPDRAMTNGKVVFYLPTIEGKSLVRASVGKHALSHSRRLGLALNNGFNA